MIQILEWKFEKFLLTYDKELHITTPLAQEPHNRNALPLHKNKIMEGGRLSPFVINPKKRRKMSRRVKENL